MELEPSECSLSMSFRPFVFGELVCFRDASGHRCSFDHFSDIRCRGIERRCGFTGPIRTQKQIQSVFSQLDPKRSQSGILLQSNTFVFEELWRFPSEENNYEAMASNCTNTQEERSSESSSEERKSLIFDYANWHSHAWLPLSKILLRTRRTKTNRSRMLTMIFSTYPDRRI